MITLSVIVCKSNPSLQVSFSSVFIREHFPVWIITQKGTQKAYIGSRNNHVCSMCFCHMVPAYIPPVLDYAGSCPDSLPATSAYILHRSDPAGVILPVTYPHCASTYGGHQMPHRRQHNVSVGRNLYSLPGYRYPQVKCPYSAGYNSRCGTSHRRFPDHPGQSNNVQDARSPAGILPPCRNG